MARMTKTEAASRILETRNREWGFYGTIHDDPNGKKLHADFAWIEAMRALTEQGGSFRLEPEIARDLLDTPWGRHVADQITDLPGMTVREALAAVANNRRWMRETLVICKAIKNAQNDRG